MRQQRQRPWFLLHLVDEQVDEFRLDEQCGLTRGRLDCGTQLVGPHPDQDEQASLNHGGELRMRGDFPQTVGPQRHDEQPPFRMPNQRVQERLPLVCARDQGEQLLELVHHENAGTLRPSRRSGRDVQVPTRSGSRSTPAAPSRRSCAATPARTREDLPQPDGPVTHQDVISSQPVAGTPRGLRFATEEVLGVVHFERHQALVRTDQRRSRGGQCRRSGTDPG